MCGIIAYVGKKQAQQILLEGLERLEYRGYDSAGICIYDADTQSAHLERAVGRVSNLKEAISTSSLPGTQGIGHTRWATHGEVSKENSHPHFDCKKEIFLAHNGIIENYAELKAGLEKRGHKFSSQTDTEVLAHLIEEYNALPLEEAVRKGLAKIKGAYAIVVMSTKEPGKIVGARNSSPLMLAVGNDELFFASDSSAILPYTKKAVYLDDGELAVLQNNEFSIFDLNHQIKDKKIARLEWSVEQSQKGGYPHFMLKEIMEQPETFHNTLRGRTIAATGNIKFGGVENIRKKLDKITNIIFIGCGTAYHAGILGKYFMEDLAGIPSSVEVASEFRYRNPVIAKNTLIVAVSQSGETADTLAVVKEAKHKGITTLGLVNVVGSSIAREVDAGIYTHIGPEIGVASTKAFSGQVADAFMLAIFFARSRTMGELEGKALIQELDAMPRKIKQVLAQKDHIQSIAKKYYRAQSFLYLGRRYSYPLAKEGALKLKEISYIHAEGYPAGEIKHGPIAMVSDAMPVLIFAPRDSVYEKSIANAEEIKARGGKIIAILTARDTKGSAIADDTIYIPKTIEPLNPIIESTAIQLFAYFIGTMLGYDVDKPRNLAKSVTVE